MVHENLKKNSANGPNVVVYELELTYALLIVIMDFVYYR
jgi:hypothetical protein